jgi:hypothetical protein
MAPMEREPHPSIRGSSLRQAKNNLLFLGGDLRSFAPGFRKTNGNGLFSAFDLLAASTPQRPFLSLMHGLLHGLLSAFAISRHVAPFC